MDYFPETISRKEKIEYLREVFDERTPEAMEEYYKLLRHGIKGNFIATVANVSLKTVQREAYYAILSLRSAILDGDGFLVAAEYINVYNRTNAGMIARAAMSAGIEVLNAHTGLPLMVHALDGVASTWKGYQKSQAINWADTALSLFLFGIGAWQLKIAHRKMGVQKWVAAMWATNAALTKFVASPARALYSMVQLLIMHARGVHDQQPKLRPDHDIPKMAANMIVSYMVAQSTFPDDPHMQHIAYIHAVRRLVWAAF